MEPLGSSMILTTVDALNFSLQGGWVRWYGVGVETNTQRQRPENESNEPSESGLVRMLFVVSFSLGITIGAFRAEVSFLHPAVILLVAFGASFYAIRSFITERAARLGQSESKPARAPTREVVTTTPSNAPLVVEAAPALDTDSEEETLSSSTNVPYVDDHQEPEAETESKDEESSLIEESDTDEIADIGAQDPTEQNPSEQDSEAIPDAHNDVQIENEEAHLEDTPPTKPHFVLEVLEEAAASQFIDVVPQLDTPEANHLAPLEETKSSKPHFILEKPTPESKPLEADKAEAVVPFSPPDILDDGKPKQLLLDL